MLLIRRWFWYQANLVSSSSSALSTSVALSQILHPGSHLPLCKVRIRVLTHGIIEMIKLYHSYPGYVL